MKDDNYMNPNEKARWGFSGKAGKIKVGPKTVGQTGGVEHVRVEPENEAARHNGGGEKPTKADDKKAK